MQDRINYKEWAQGILLANEFNRKSLSVIEINKPSLQEVVAELRSSVQNAVNGNVSFDQLVNLYESHYFDINLLSDTQVNWLIDNNHYDLNDGRLYDDGHLLPAEAF